MQRYCYIRQAYFLEHSDFQKLLDPGNPVKQSQRHHLCIPFVIGNNTIYVPLRNNLGEPVRKYGRIGHAVPSQKHENAGLDYRHSLVINDKQYIEYSSTRKIPRAQYRYIEQHYKEIKEEVITYVRRYIKVAKKNRISKEPLFRESSLINFHKELYGG